MKIQNRNRAMLLALVGGYVIYLAYEMMRDELAGKSSMAMWLCILLVILMGAAGIAVLIPSVEYGQFISGLLIRKKIKKGVYPI